MLIVGERARPIPLVASSEPMTSPYWRARLGSKAAASAMGAGSWVTPGKSLTTVFMKPEATPAAPSCSVIWGMHSAGMAGV